MQNDLRVQLMNYEDLRTRMSEKHAFEVVQSFQIKKMDRQITKLEELKVNNDE